MSRGGRTRTGDPAQSGSSATQAPSASATASPESTTWKPRSSLVARSPVHTGLSAAVVPGASGAGSMRWIVAPPADRRRTSSVIWVRAMAANAGEPRAMTCPRASRGNGGQ
jgi:hypothetical protein